MVMLQLPKGLRHKNSLMIVTYCLAELVSDAVKDFIEPSSNTKIYSSTSSINLTSALEEEEIFQDSFNRDICGFVGSTLFALKKKYKKNKKEKEVQFFLEVMTTSHHTVAGNKEYVEKYCSPYDLLNNNGGLALVFTKLFSFCKRSNESDQ